MADSNMGSLFVSLGIRDEMSKTIRKIVKDMNGVDEATEKAKRRGNELIKSLNNANASNFAKIFKNASKYIEENARGISGIISMLKTIESNNPNILTEKFLGAKNLNEVSSMLNTINLELVKAAKLAAEARKNEGGTGGKEGNDAAYWQARIANALKYIGILQDLKLLQEKIDATKSDNPNVNTRKLEEARRSIEAFKSDVSKMLSFGGVDSSYVLSGFANTFSRLSKEINGTLAKFKKENPLSALTGPDKIRATMSNIKNMRDELQKLMNEGLGKGFKTSMLDDNLVALKNRLIELDRVLNKDTARMSDKKYMNGLYSNIAADMTLARNAMKEYGREKGKVIAQEKAAGEAERQRQAEIKNSERRYDSLGNKVRQLRAEFSKGISIGADTSKAESEILRLMSVMRNIRDIENSLKSESGWKSALGKLGNLGNGHDTTIAGRALEDQKAINQEVQKGIELRERQRLVDDKISGAERRQEKAMLSARRLIENLDRMREKSVNIGINTSRLDSVRSEINLIRESLSSFAGKGLLGQGFKDELANLSIWSTKAADALKKQSEIINGQERGWKDAVTSGINGSRYATPGSKEAAEGYLKLADAYSKALETLQTKHKDAEAKLGKQIDEYQKEINDLEKKIKSISPKMDGLAWNGKALSPKDKAAYEEYMRLLEHVKNTKEPGIIMSQVEFDREEDRIRRLMSLIQGYKEFAEKIANGTYKPYNAAEYEQKRISETAALKNAMIEREAERKKAEAEKKRAEAKAEKEAAKAKRDNARDERQRQTEIKNTERRYDSLGNKVRQLRAEFSKGIAVGADVSKVENEIHRLIAIMRRLQNVGDLLKNPNGWKAHLGTLGNLGSGHDTTLASRVLQDQRAVNREARMGVEIEQKRQKEIAKSGARVQADLVRGFERANSHAGKLNSTLQDLKSLFLQGGLVFGAQQFAMSIITTGGEMEKQHIALQSILGDIQNANTMFNQIKELALNSPFTFSELNRDVKQLAAYGVEYEDLYNTTKRLADMSSGLGVSFDRIALAFGQVQSRGWLDGKELRQIAYAGIPLLNKLSEFYSKQEGRNVSTSEIKKRISNREVSFDDVKSIFWQMTSEGGQFFNMQQVLSETLLGRYNKLKDAWEIMLADFADGKSVVGGTFKFIIDQVTNLVQLMHTFSLVALGAMSGFALKKMSMLLAGNAASNFLTNKEKLAQDIKARVLMGQQLSAVEQRILATKKLITKEDLQALVAAKATTKTELQRLYLSGKISRELYKQAVTQAGMNTFWTNFANRGGVAISLLRKGIGSMVSSLWTMIGGLPGLLITAFSVGIGYVISKYRELSQSIEQTQNELDDKLKQIRNFRSGNNSNLIKALASKDTKEIDNLIDTYKEKLKELAPYNFNNIVMGAEEKKSHEERLKYLDQELQKLEDADKAAKGRLLDRDNYSDLKSAIEYANQFYDNKDKLTYRYIADGVDKNVARQKAFSVDRYAEFNANQIRDRIAEIFGDIKKDDGIRLQAEQAMSNIFSALGVPEDRANEIRASVLQAFGIGEKDSWLQGEVRSKMQSLIDSSFPRIGAKIRANKDLTKAEQDKVRELMGDAKQGLIRQYPELEKTLQNLLNSSKFQAVIKLVYTTDDKYNDMTSELVGRMPNALDPDVESKYLNFAKKWGKDNSYYGGRNAAKADIDAAYNEYQSALKSKSKDVNKKRDAWLLVKDAAKALLYYDYSGEGKKSNKPGKKGSQEDAELKALQERLSSLKSARQMYQKYQTRFDDDYSKEKTMKLFPEVTGLNLDDYEEAVHSLLKGFKINTTERKKFQTSVYREVAEWIFDEKDKKVFDEKAATFTDELNRLASNWDLYKELLQKTGNKDFASAAFSTSPYLIDEKVSELMLDYQNKYGKDFKKQDFMSLSDGQAKSLLKGPGEYEAWRKITDLLRNNYVKALQDAADIIEKTEDYEDKIFKIRKKYTELIEKTGDAGIKVRYEQQRDKEIGQVKLEQFKNSGDYLNFYGAIVSLGMEKAQTIGARIRKNINEALSNGSIDAREYSKEIKLLEEQLMKLSQRRKTFLNGGLNGIAEQKISDSAEQLTLATSKINEGKKTLELGERLGDEDLIARGKSMIASGKAMEKAALVLFKDGTKAKESLDKFSGAVNAIDQNIQGMAEAFNDIKETASLLGIDTESDAWQNASAFFESLSGMSSSLSKVVTSAESGNVGGILAGVTGIFTSPIKALAKTHDNKLDRQIKLAEDQLTELKNLSSNISAEIEKTLGGIYSYRRSDATSKKLGEIKGDYEKWQAFGNTWFGSIYGGTNKSHYSKDTYDSVIKSASNVSAYQDQLTLLKAQEDELRKQRKAEDDKKKTDKSKLADYDQQITEMELQIKTFAQDFLKTIYSIDMKSWASQLTDAVVGAWEKGENAVDAYRNKVKDMVKDVTKNIVSQKVMEKLLESPLDFLTKQLDAKGQLDETDMTELAKKLYDAGEKAIPQITGIFEALKNQGLDLRENGSSSTTNSIKGITEETADLLASYVNAIRLDVSVIREEQAKYLPEMSEITKSQLTQLNAIAKNTLRNADAAERIDRTVSEFNDNFNKVLNGTKSLRMK